MDVTTTRRDFRCDECEKFGKIEVNEQSHLPIADGTWFEVRTQGGGVAKHMCDLACVNEFLNQTKFNKQTVVTIKKSLIRDA